LDEISPVQNRLDFLKKFAKFLLNVKDKKPIQFTIFPFSGKKKIKKKTFTTFGLQF